MNEKKIIFCTGPGELVKDYLNWKSGRRTSSETSYTYSSFIFNFVKKNKHNAWIISYNESPETIDDPQFKIENRPKNYFLGKKSIGFHLTEIHYALMLLISAIKFKAQYIVVDSGTTHWWALLPLKFCGVEIIPNFLNVYYPATNPPRSITKKIIKFLDSIFFKYCTARAVGISPECGKQYQEMSTKSHICELYNSLYNLNDFTWIEKPKWPTEIFKLIFIGRITESKGIFDLLKITKKLLEGNYKNIHVDICGDGPELNSAIKLALDLEIENKITFHKQLDRTELLKLISASHLVIVPTNSNFCEGLPRSCAEGILSSRPVVTSILSNATVLLESALLVAEAEDINSYTEKITQVINDPKSYNELVKSCSKYYDLFTDKKYSLESALKRAFL